MKFLVIGGSGLIGSHLLRAARMAGHGSTGTYRKFSLPGLVPLDCADTGAFQELVEKAKPDAVIHAAGWTWVDGCEDDPKRAFAENSEQPSRLAEVCKRAGIRFAYFSSSYVFDGREGPYAEEARPNPINVYGQSKLEGERGVMAASDGSALIARVICVYGAEAQKKNFAFQVWRAMVEGREMVLPSDQCGNPTYAGDIARWLAELMSKGESGVWHLGGPWPDCTRPEWAEKLVAGFRAAGIEPRAGFGLRTVPTAELKQKALRPLKAGLVCARPGGLPSPATDFDLTVREMVANME